MAVIITRTAPPAVPTGVSASAVNGWDKCYNEESGALVDRTTEFITVANDVDSFAADDDYVYFSIEAIDTDSRVVHIHLILSQFASVDIVPTFEYSTGDDAWATLAVTDGTNGFTQDGSIIVDLDTMPSSSAWAIATKDGSGNTIGDGTARRYIRIKRTVNTLVTPPQISESGSGVLSASTTYYYKVIATKNSGLYGQSSRGRIWSAPTSEFSATTTVVKRTIKVIQNSGGEDYLVWRTATSGEYKKDGRLGGGGQTATNYIDTECQAVKGWYFGEWGGSGGADAYLMDNGMAKNANSYGATQGRFAYYSDVLYSGVEKGVLNISTTDGTVANMEDIWNECQTQGWTDALVKHHYPNVVDGNQRRVIYTNNDHIDISGDFSEVGMTLYMRAIFSTYLCTSATFGRRIQVGSSFHYDSGVEFILANGICYNALYYYKNTKFYACKFIQASIAQSRIYARFPAILDDCELHDCMLDGYLNFENPTFSGANLVIKNVIVSRTRYGLDITPAALTTIDMSDLTIQGGTAISNRSPYWQEGDEHTFTGFKFVGISTFLLSYSLTSNDSNVTLNFINPTFDGASITTARGGQNWIYNEQYTFDLKVVDARGNVIEGANVSIKDSADTEVASGVTDASGDLAQKTITYKQYTGGTAVGAYGQYLADDVTTLSPHRIVISKTGYVTKTSKITIDKKTTQVETLENRREV